MDKNLVFEKQNRVIEHASQIQNRQLMTQLELEEVIALARDAYYNSERLDVSYAKLETIDRMLMIIG